MQRYMITHFSWHALTYDDELKANLFLKVIQTSRVVGNTQYNKKVTKNNSVITKAFLFNGNKI